VKPFGPLTDAAHPLAVALGRALVREVTAGRVLVIGAGSGRNLAPFLDAGLRVDVLEESAARASAVAALFAAQSALRVIRAPYDEPLGAGEYDGALSTHALLHGRLAQLRAAVQVAHAALHPGAPFFLTLGARADPRYGAGHQLEADVWVAESGSEAGVPHAFFDEAGARTLMRDFHIDALEERSAAGSVGRWAHTPAEAERTVHWFVRARKDSEH